MYNSLSNSPIWKSVMVTRQLPEALSGLEVLCKNLWWCWNDSAKALFASIDREMWHNSGHNPMVILDKVSIKRYNVLAKDSAFLAQLGAVMREFNEYMAKKSERVEPSVGYFCMEYGLDTSLKIYSGGLGILAGDYLKETSDMNVNLVAVGLFYKYGYFTQKITALGNQEAQYDAQDFMKSPAQPVLDSEGNWMKVRVGMPGRDMFARIWRVDVGRTELYLLDTDFEDNQPEDRQVTHHLYGGDWENRLKQEILLGIGGVRALRVLGKNPTIFHYNEGHAAFAALERLKEYVQQQHLSFSEALEVVKASSLFTTHTPVPAGHDAFTDEFMGRYLAVFTGYLNIDWRKFMSLGKVNPDNTEEKFSMSNLAANVSQNVNGVSMLHGEVSKEIFSNLYPGYLPEELYISYVTNGVHYSTWASALWKKLHARVFGSDFQTHHYDKSCFDGVYQLSDEEVWDTRMSLKKSLTNTIRERLIDATMSAHYSPKQKVAIAEAWREDALTIGFARRFATYKRATLLFSDLDRLDAIVNNPERPVQFIFAGKAHPADGMGQDFMRQVIEISKQERFIGKIIFIPGYDINLAKRMVQGVDVWLNNPTRPLEASGTSGEKASMNGVMHFSVLDGWWVEGYKENAGWALPQEARYDDANYQNELDASFIYYIIENEIAPAYYNVDKSTGRSSQWIGYIKNTIAKVASNFTTNRMLTDYCNQYYIPQSKRFESICSNDYAITKEIVAWKDRVCAEWNNIHVISCKRPESSYTLSPDGMLKSEVVVDLRRLKPDDVGVEMLFTTVDRHGKYHIQEVSQFSLEKYEDGIATFATSIQPERTGMYDVGIRIYPKNDLLPHRQDLPFVKWL